MVNLCTSFMKKKSMKFSTNVDPVKSKTKCVIFSPRKIAAVSPIELNNDDLPWVNEIKHLGNLLESNNSMKRDITVKEAD